MQSIIPKLREAFNKKRNIKIKYYSPHNDETKWRIISIYKLEKDFLIAYCHLRDDERTFVITRIISAIIQETDYKIPGDWAPKCNVWNSK